MTWADRLLLVLVLWLPIAVAIGNFIEAFEE